MKILVRHFIILLAQLFILTICAAESIKIYETKNIKNTPASIKKIIQVKNLRQTIDIPCSRVYNSGKIWVLERHCTKNIQRLYVFDALGIRKFNWYDKKFSHWVWQEGCNALKKCYYKVTLNNNGQVTGFIYYYSINQSAGFYKVEIKDNKLIITEEKTIDLV